MAPPSNRRPGHSRRAQFTTFFAYLAAFAGLAIGVVWLIGSRRDPAAHAALRGAASDIAAPPAALAANGRTASQGILATIGGFLTSGSRVAQLEREVAEARTRLAEQAALAEENQRLKAMLAIRDGDPHPVAIARLIGSTAASTRRFATLGVGSNSGVEVGMPVRSNLGLVGRVLEAGRTTSRVLLITDAESVVPVRRASDGVAAFATGRSDGMVQIRLINLGINPLRKGDALVTSGSGGLYRPGIAFAVVAELTRDGALARPLSDPGTTEFVAVDPLWAPPVAPPAPSPSPTPAPAKPAE